MSTLSTPQNPPAAALRDNTVVRNIRSGSPDSIRPQLNADLGMSLSRESYLYLRSYFRQTALRDPTVGELRLLDSLIHYGIHTADRIAVGELVTASHHVASIWADMMAKHGILHDIDHHLLGGKAVAAPPCTLTDALSLTGAYLHRAELRPDEDTVILSSPHQEAVALAEGYTPVARVAVGREIRSLWTRKGESPETIPPRTGELILYIPHARPEQIQALVAGEDQRTRSSLGDLRAVAQRSFLLTLTELAPAVTLHANRLAENGQSNGRIPVELLCGSPHVDPDGTCGYLLRIPLKMVQVMNRTLKELGLHAVVCGQVRTGGNTVIHIRDAEGKRDIPVVNLPAEFLLSVASANLYAMTVAVSDEPAPVPTYPALSRLPSASSRENGLTPDGHETVALTLHEGQVLRIPEADTLMTVLAVDVLHGSMAYTAAANTVATATNYLADFGISPQKLRLSVSLAATSAQALTDGTALSAICGVYCVAAERGIPVEDPVISVASAEVPLRITVTAWARDPAICAGWVATDDHQWRTSGLPVSKDFPCFLLPVLRRSYEDSLKALSAALNRDRGVGCVIRPIVVDVAQEEETKTTRYTLNPESVKQFTDQLTERNIPVISMCESDTRLFLSDPAVTEFLRRHIDGGYSILVLGESCKPFAEYGFLPAALTEVKTLPTSGTTATVTYAFPADAATRLIRTEPLAPADPREAMKDRHLLTLYLPDGTALPDGFVGCDGKVLGLLNGIDTTILSCIRGPVFTL